LAFNAASISAAFVTGIEPRFQTFCLKSTPPEMSPNEGHDDPVGECLHHCRKCSADDHADSEIENVAARDERFEIFPHKKNLSLEIGVEISCKLPQLTITCQ
jgi:hypothetical protein